MSQQQKPGRKPKPDHIRVNRSLHKDTIAKLERLVAELRDNPQIHNVSQSSLIDWLVNRIAPNVVREQYAKYDQRIRARRSKSDLS